MLVKQALPIPNLATFKTVGWHSIMILILASSDPYRVSILPFIQQITRGPNWSLLNCSRTVGLNVSWGTKLKDQIDMAVHLSDGGIIWVFLQKSNGEPQLFNKIFLITKENLDATLPKWRFGRFCSFLNGIYFQGTCLSIHLSSGPNNSTMNSSTNGSPTMTSGCSIKRALPFELKKLELYFRHAHKKKIHPRKLTWIPKMMGLEKVTPFKYGYFGYLC